MKRLGMWAKTGAVLFGAASLGYGMGIDVVNNEKVDLSIGARAQLIGYAENVADPIRDNNRAYLFLKEARLNLHGRVTDYKFNTEWAFAAEDISTSNNDLTLLDLAFDVPFFKVADTWLKIGQYKVPFGREMLAYEGNLQFAERSLMNLGFGMSRDVGVSLHTQKPRWNGTFGVFTGGGRDVPLRFLPEVLGFPLVAARFGYNDGVDKDVYTTAQNDLQIKATQKSLHVNALFIKDTLIGHSTVLNVKAADKTLLQNGNWNPYIGRTPLVRGDLWQAGVDGVLRVPLSERSSWSSEAEVNQAEFNNRYGSIHLTGLRAQTGVLVDKVEVALRYSGLVPDDAFAKTAGSPIMGKTIVSEIVPAVTYYVKGHDFKIVLDAPVLLNAPVSIERVPAVGAYVLTEQPDQLASSSGTPFELRKHTVTQARLMVQLAF